VRAASFPVRSVGAIRSVAPFAPLAVVPLEKAGLLSGSFVPGTSMLGFFEKKLLGLNSKLTCSTGMLREN
jgi:hypothetical protein